LYETELLHIGVKSNDVDGLHTSTPAKVGCLLSASDIANGEIPNPTPSQYEEIIRLLNEYVSMGVPSTEDIEEIAGRLADEKILIAKDEIEDKIESSHMVNITRIFTPYPTEEQINSIVPPEGHGARYVVSTNGKPPLYYYSYDANTKTWVKGYQLKGSTLYLNLSDGCMYRYTNSTTTKPYPNFIKMTKSVTEIDEELETKQDNLSFDGVYDAKNNKVATVKTVDDKINALINGADTSFDTLKEIADWIKDHPNSVTEINSKIQANTARILTNETAITNLNRLVSLLESNKQNKSDSGLNTSSKLIVGAINEINSKVTQLGNSALTESELKEIVRETAVTTESDPTVPNWAKQADKPTYTYEEIKEKPDIVEDISSSIAEETNVLTIELKDKSGKVIASTEVTIPKGGETPDLNGYVRVTDIGNGLRVASDGKVNISGATQTQIDAGASNSEPLTTNNIRYAVKKGVTDSNEEWTKDDKAKACETIGAVKQYIPTANNTNFVYTSRKDGSGNVIQGTYRISASVMADVIPITGTGGSLPCGEPPNGLQPYHATPRSWVENMPDKVTLTNDQKAKWRAWLGIE
jgi:hypothetical protein